MDMDDHCCCVLQQVVRGCKVTVKSTSVMLKAEARSQHLMVRKEHG